MHRRVRGSFDILKFPLLQWLPSKLRKCCIVIPLLSGPPSWVEPPGWSSVAPRSLHLDYCEEGLASASFQSVWWCQRPSWNVMGFSSPTLPYLLSGCRRSALPSSSDPLRGNLSKWWAHFEGGRQTACLLWVFSAHLSRAPWTSPSFFRVCVFSIF